MRKPKEYLNLTWQVKYLFFIGWKRKAFLSYMYKGYNLRLDIGEYEAGKTFEIVKQSQHRIVVWSLHKTAYDVVAHECLHAANFTLSRAGVHADFDNDESQAYLMSELIRQALEIE